MKALVEAEVFFVQPESQNHVQIKRSSGKKASENETLILMLMNFNITKCGLIRSDGAKWLKTKQRQNKRTASTATFCSSIIHKH